MRIRTCKVLILCALVWCCFANAVDAAGGLEGAVLDPEGRALPGAQVNLQNQASGKSITTVTGPGGVFAIQDVPEAAYTLTISLDGFESVVLSLPALPNRKLQITLPQQTNLNEDVTVKGTVEGLLQREEPEQRQKMDDSTLDYVPIADQRFQDALPLVPSVVRGPDGNINMSGARASESSLLVNGSNVTDPVTGSFAIELPLEAVETVDVYTNPYSAEYGRFTGGVTSIYTRAGEDRFKFEFNDFVPRLHFTNGLKTEGVEAWMPRIRLSGPTGVDGLYFSQAVQYKYLRTFLDNIPGDPDVNVTRLQALDSLTQIDYLANVNNQWSVTASAFPENSENENLNTFLPVESTPDFQQRGFNLAIINRRIFNDGAVLESLLSHKSYDVSILPKSEMDGPFVLTTADGMRGNYFNYQERDSGRLQWSETYSFRPLAWEGTHWIKSGLEWSRTEFSGDVKYETVEVTRADGSMAEQDTFSGPGKIGALDHELSGFLQDRWQFSDEWTFDGGLRWDYVGAAGNRNWSPRFAFSFAPRVWPKTAFKGGAGVFYDKIYLNAFSFEDYPVRTITLFGEDGHVLNAQTLIPEVRGDTKTPYGLTWNLEFDQEFADRLLLRVNYLSRDSHDQLIVQPADERLLLTSEGKSRYRQWEITTQVQIRKESRLFFSYIHSSTKGDLNDFDSSFGNFQRPLIRENDYGYLPFDVSHRFLSWGVVKIPGSVFVSPVLEVRSGFRYSAVDQLQNFTGARNSYQFPVFSQLDLRVTRTFEVLRKYQVTVGMKVFNLLNRFNPRDVQNNLDSPAFGTYYNTVKRQFRAAFEIKY